MHHNWVPGDDSCSCSSGGWSSSGTQTAGSLDGQEACHHLFLWVYELSCLLTALARVAPEQVPISQAMLTALRRTASNLNHMQAWSAPCLSVPGRDRPWALMLCTLSCRPVSAVKSVIALTAKLLAVQLVATD